MLKMNSKSETTRSMEIRANAVKRFVISLMKMFRICRGKKHKNAENPPEKTHIVQKIIAVRSDITI